MNVESGIYCIRNIVNNKVYIGRTCNLNKRKSEHFRTLNLNSHYNEYLQNAYNKYGNDKFEFLILEHCDKDFLLLREHFWCLYFNANNPEKGYNISLTGDREFVGHSEESKRKISKSHIGKIVSIETRKRISKAKKNTKHSEETKCKMRDWYSKNIHPMSKGHSDKSKKKMSLSKIGKPSNNRLEIICQNIVTQEEITFITISDAAEKLNILKTSIVNNLKGRSNIVNKKFKFKYVKS